MKSRAYLLASCLILAIPATALAQDILMQSARNLFKPIPTQPPAIKGIESTPARVELGKQLYFDPRLSESHSISCNSCHRIGLGGVDVQETSIGHRWQRGPRNAQPCSMRFSTPHSSGTGVPRTSRNRPAARWSTP